MEDKLSWPHLLQSCILKGNFQTDNEVAVGREIDDIV